MMVGRRKACGVPPAGFEPAVSTLKGWRPRPLDYGGIVRDACGEPDGILRDGERG